MGKGRASNGKDDPMKFTMTGMLFISLAVSAFAQTPQNPDRAKWMCRNLADSGNFLYEGETVFGTQACRPIPQAPSPAPATPVVEAPSQNQPAPAPVAKHDKPLVFISGTAATTTTTTRGFFGSANSSTMPHDQAMVLAQDFSSVCPTVETTIKQDNADYTIVVNGGLNIRNQLLLTDKDGKVLYTDNKGANGIVGGKSGTIKGKVSKACSFILTNWNGK